MASDADLHRLLGQIEAKLDHLIIAQKTHDDRTIETEKRLRVVEQQIARTQTIGGAIAFVVTILATIFPVFWNRGS
jgi:hypothetical protein